MEEFWVKQVRHSFTTPGLLGTWSLLCDYEEVMFLWWCWAGTSHCAGQGGMGWQVVGEMKKAWDYPTTMRKHHNSVTFMWATVLTHRVLIVHLWWISQLNQSLASNCYTNRWWKWSSPYARDKLECQYSGFVYACLLKCVCVRVWTFARVQEQVQKEQFRTHRRFAALSAWHGCCMRSAVSKSRLSERRHDHVDLMDSWWLVFRHLWTVNWIMTAAKHTYQPGLQSAMISLMGYSLVLFNWKTNLKNKILD